MQRHPLEITELLTLVGSFIPLWEITKGPWTDQFSFRPITLCRCLQVSKLWHQTLVPILWQGYWSGEDMSNVPEFTLYFYGHLFESVHFRLPPLQDFPDHLGVYSLKGLGVFMGEAVREEDICAGGGTRTSLSAGARAGKGGGGREPTMHLKKGRQLIRTYQSGTSSIGGERLIRTNWRLQKLYFHGEEDYEYPPPLDIKNFDGLRRLEDLSLHGWDCSEGQLSKILWLLAGTLKKLDVGWITNVRLDELADYNLPDSLQQSGDDTSGKNGSRGIRTNDTASKELVLSRLESIKIDTHFDPIDHYLTVLVRGCPSLVSLEARLDDSVLDSTRLANNLRVHCPQLSALVLLVPLRYTTSRPYSDMALQMDCAN